MNYTFIGKYNVKDSIKHYIEDIIGSQYIQGKTLITSLYGLSNLTAIETVNRLNKEALKDYDNQLKIISPIRLYGETPTHTNTRNMDWEIRNTLDVYHNSEVLDFNSVDYFINNKSTDDDLFEIDRCFNIAFDQFRYNDIPDFMKHKVITACKMVDESDEILLMDNDRCANNYINGRNVRKDIILFTKMCNLINTYAMYKNKKVYTFEYSRMRFEDDSRKFLSPTP